MITYTYDKDMSIKWDIPNDIIWDITKAMNAISVNLKWQYKHYLLQLITIKLVGTSKGHSSDGIILGCMIL